MKYYLLKEVVSYLLENVQNIKLIKRIDNNIIIIEFNDRNNLYFDMSKGNSLIYKRENTIKAKKDFNAPFDVTLPIANKKNKKQQTTVVQPDIVVVCDETKLDKQGCNGVPDLVVEILSPGNTKKEMKFKFEVYQEAKIPEYWVIDPQRQFMMCYFLNDKDIYVGSAPYTDEAVFESKVLKGFQLPLSRIFTGSKFD